MQKIEPLQEMALRLHTDYINDVLSRSHASPLTDPNCHNGVSLYLETDEAKRATVFWDLMREGGDGSLFNELSWHLNHLEANRHFDETLAFYATLVGFVIMAHIKEDDAFLAGLAKEAKNLDDCSINAFMLSPLIKEALITFANKNSGEEGAAILAYYQSLINSAGLIQQ